MIAEESSSRPPVATQATQQPGSARQRQVWLGGLLVLLVCLLLLDGRVWRSCKLFVGGDNAQIWEAQAWWNGRLHLPKRVWDTAPANGRAYSHFPVMFSILAAGVVPLFDGVPRWFLLVVVVLPVPILGYALCYRKTGSPLWAVVLGIGFVCGTSAWPVFTRVLRLCEPYYVNHLLATSGLLIFLIEYFGRRRVWLCGLGLIIATLSRQMTVVYAIPLLFIAASGQDLGQRYARLLQLAVVGLVIAVVPLGMNTVKFGHPLETGYMRIYQDRDDRLATDAKTYGLFSTHFVPRNLYYTNIGLPTRCQVRVRGEYQERLRPNLMGTGIWWTTPLLVWLFVDIRRILADAPGRLLLVGAGLVYVGLLFFHGTGYTQHGYNRFSLDYLPALIALIAPGCFVGRRRWISLALIAWSVVYFECLI